MLSRLARNPSRALLLCGLAAFVVACQDSERRIAAPSFAISDGSSGGNTEFFFYPPLAANPSGDPNFDAGAANPFLAPFAKICELVLGSDPEGSDATCVLDVTPPGNPGGLALVFDAAGGFYKVNWHTAESNLDENKIYRIEVFAVPVVGPPTAQDRADYLYGFRDIDPATNVGSCTGEPFCKVNNGSNVAIKVRIERFASCFATRTCASRFISANQDANLTLPSTNELFVPAQGGTDFFVNFDLCSAEEAADVDAAIDLRTFGPCFKTKTPFTGTLTEPAILSICQLLVIPPEIPHSQSDQITLHHFSTEEGSSIQFVEALPEAHQCLGPQASAPSGSPLLRFARALGNWLLTFVTPRPLVASAVAIDVGGGGLTDELGSFFKLALPGKFEYEDPADEFQATQRGSTTTVRAKVTDLLGNPIFKARVRWLLVSSPLPNPPAATLAPPLVVFTDANGVAEVTLTLDTDAGDNVVHATGRGIADRDNNGPRLTYDPFIPLNFTIDGIVGERERIVENTRLQFTVCGRGSGVRCIR